MSGSSKRRLDLGDAQARYRPQPRVSRATPAPRPAAKLPNATSTDPIRKARRIPLLLASCTAGIFGFYAVQVYIGLNREGPTDVPSEVADRYNNIADRFDSDVGGVEYWWGIDSLRRKMTRKARGDVLELSVGTGRNMEYYPLKQCTSVTMVDLSGPMLEVARQKWKERYKMYTRAHFREQSALEPVPSPTGTGFDTIIQTMGLCSTSQPLELLQNMGRMTREDGQILLLEHGRSNYEWLNNIIDKSAPGHADKFGCWWNKDIAKIVEQSGLEVVKIERPWYHLGTTYWIELKPPPRKTEVVQTPRQPTNVEAENVSQRPWWRFWG